MPDRPVTPTPVGRPARPAGLLLPLAAALLLAAAGAPGLWLAPAPEASHTTPANPGAPTDPPQPPPPAPATSPLPLTTTTSATTETSDARAEFLAWAREDPAAALAWLDSRPSREPPDLDPYPSLYALALASRSFHQAVAWADHRADPRTRLLALHAVAGEWLRADPVAALDLALGLPDDPLRADLIARAAGEWAARAPDHALRWVWRLPDSAERSAALPAVILSYAEVDPSGARIMAEDEVAPGRAQNDLLTRLRPAASPPWSR